MQYSLVIFRISFPFLYYSSFQNHVKFFFSVLALKVYKALSVVAFQVFDTFYSDFLQEEIHVLYFI